MRFHCVAWEKKHDAKKEWHRWFAWHPVKLKDQDECVWLETVERKGEWTFDYGGGAWDWEYRSV